MVQTKSTPATSAAAPTTPSTINCDAPPVYGTTLAAGAPADVAWICPSLICDANPVPAAPAAEAEDVPTVAAAVMVEPAAVLAEVAVLDAFPPYGAGAGTGSALPVLFASWTKFAHVSLVVLVLWMTMDLSPK